MVVPYLYSHLFYLCLKGNIGLDRLFIGESILDVHVAEIAVVICELFFTWLH